MGQERVLISTGTRGLFRRLMTDSTIGEIEQAFYDEGFTPVPDPTYQDTGARRSRAQDYLHGVNWSDQAEVSRALRVFERLLHGFSPESLSQLQRSLRRDSYELSDRGEIEPVGPRIPDGALSNLRDASAILDHLDRIQRGLVEDPAQVIGSAKELIESTAKLVLQERGASFGENDKLPALINRAQETLGLRPADALPGPDGSHAVKRVLGGATALAIGVDELRNKGWGTGHGQAGGRTGLRERHAHLAVNAAFTWCQLMLDTLADPQAPWRSESP